MTRHREGDLLHRHVVDSSSIDSIGYEPNTAVLEIAFTEGGLYHYFMVPASVFHRLMKADSKGRFFAEFIRDKFRFEQV